MADREADERVGGELAAFGRPRQVSRMTAASPLVTGPSTDRRRSSGGREFVTVLRGGDRAHERVRLRRREEELQRGPQRPAGRRRGPPPRRRRCRESARPRGIRTRGPVPRGSRTRCRRSGADAGAVGDVRHPDLGPGPVGEQIAVASRRESRVALTRHGTRRRGAGRAAGPRTPVRLQARSRPSRGRRSRAAPVGGTSATECRREALTRRTRLLAIDPATAGAGEGGRFDVGGREPEARRPDGGCGGRARPVATQDPLALPRQDVGPADVAAVVLDHARVITRRHRGGKYASTIIVA